MADSVLVQGSERDCIESLQRNANKQNVIYNVAIGPSPVKQNFTYIKIQPQNMYKSRNVTTSIPIQLMWRSSYGEYDNSL